MHLEEVGPCSDSTLSRSSSQSSKYSPTSRHCSLRSFSSLQSTMRRGLVSRGQRDTVASGVAAAMEPSPPANVQSHNSTPHLLVLPPHTILGCLLSLLPQHLTDGFRTAAIPPITAQLQQVPVGGTETLLLFPMPQHCPPMNPTSTRQLPV